MAGRKRSRIDAISFDPLCISAQEWNSNFPGYNFIASITSSLAGGGPPSATSSVVRRSAAYGTEQSSIGGEAAIAVAIGGVEDDVGTGECIRGDDDGEEERDEQGRLEGNVTGGGRAASAARLALALKRLMTALP